MSTDHYTQFTFPTADASPEPQPGLILPPGFVEAIDPNTNQVVYLRVQEQPTTGAELSMLEKAQRYAAEQPDPIEAAPVNDQQRLNSLARPIAVVGGVASLGLLSAGGAVYLAGLGLHEAGPWFHDAAQFLEYAALFLVAAVVVAVVAAGKLKAAMTTTRTDGGQVVTALFHRHTEVHIQKQTGGFWKGTVNNKVR